MAKGNKIHYKWWFQFIFLAVLVLGIIGAVKYYETPQYDHPKKITSYSWWRRANGSPDDVTFTFLKAIHKQDVKLLKKSEMEEALDYYNKELFEEDMNDDDLKDLLAKANDEIIKTYGEDWFDNLYVDKVEEKSDQMHSYTLLSLKCKDKEFKCPSATVDINGKYYMHPTYADNILRNFNKQDNKQDTGKK